MRFQSLERKKGVSLIKKKNTVDMTSGPLLKKIIVFFVPIMLTNWLQMFYNAADKIVVGHFAGSAALAAVGASSSFTLFLLNLSGGVCAGMSVAVSNEFGGGDTNGLRNAVNTGMSFGCIAGLFLAVVGFFASGPVLRLLGTPEDVLEDGIQYLRIYFFSMPFYMIYSSGAALLRAVGDSKRPLLFLLISGALNCVLNCIFVVVFSLSVLGVALGTLISQIVSSVFMLSYLRGKNAPINFTFKDFAINFKKLLKMLRIGIPTGIRGALFSVSDMVIQSAVNTMGTAAVSGNAAAIAVDSFIFSSMGSVAQASMVFTGQNVGAGKIKRTKKVLVRCLGIVTVVGIVLGYTMFFLKRPIVQLMITDSPSAVEFAVDRLRIIDSTAFISGWMDVLTYFFSGFGITMIPTTVTLLGICGFRLVWVATYFSAHPSMFSLYVSYPLSAGLCLVGEIILFFVLLRRRIKSAQE